MILELPEEEQILKETLRRLALDLPERPASITTLYSILEEMGLWSLNLSVDAGGSEMNHRCAAIAIEEIARQNTSLATTLAVRLGLTNQAFSRNPESPKLPGQGPGAAILLTRPSGKASLIWPSETYCYAPQEGTFVEKPSPLSGEKPSTLLGLTEIPLVDFSLDPLPGNGYSDNVAGPTAFAALNLGIASRAAEEARRYASERTQFRKTLDSFQAIQFKLADMASQLEAARWLLYRASSQEKQSLALAALTYSEEIALQITDEALQVHGGYGYTSEYPVEALYRDALSTAALSALLFPRISK